METFNSTLSWMKEQGLSKQKFPYVAMEQEEANSADKAEEIMFRTGIEFTLSWTKVVHEDGELRIKDLNIEIQSKPICDEKDEAFRGYQLLRFPRTGGQSCWSRKPKQEQTLADEGAK